MSTHRGPGRPRYGRIATLATSVAVTAVAFLGSAGVLPAEDADDVPVAAAADPAAVDPAAAAPSTPTDQPTSAPSTDPDATADPTPDPTVEVTAEPVEDTALPARSGEGRRVVFSESRQRVWLVGTDGPQRTYPVSGSVYDNLDPGTYEVYSRSEQAWGIDDSGTMKWFVRFTQGDNAAIGFHDIPVDDGRKVQGLDELGTPLSHGCIRQRTSDAKALWDFAPLGTTVVVTA
ncbi:L,D-transpeptidase [Nocardioides sp. AX2bis]|uniref:L,D-transpeptidase n=1 Tax=Nocardioides sp. AX2bis TaxID=2653157 RepID=UPI0012EFAA4D|nr:L,D-transpeptidase [Nocardioides sp. AX2bis]VXB13434.1 L,D-transpeptidase catalytic domain [Nocardioides sp. AX2bis]